MMHTIKVKVARIVKAIVRGLVVDDGIRMDGLIQRRELMNKEGG